ncbi:MAG TPA: biopolymer transporter ExbD, partial [Hanamia sp.]|nr:biopolymer transporter ExbD [Hanamia sp.]
NKVAPEKNYLTVTIDKTNKVYLTMDEKLKGDVLDELGKEKNITFTPQEKKEFEQATFIGTPISQLTQFDKLTPEQVKATNLPGIPVDSSNNELASWIGAAIAVRMGETLNYLIKGDDAAKYSTFSKVIDAFKKNDVYKYMLITNAKEVPEGSELYKKNLEAHLEGKKAGK